MTPLYLHRRAESRPECDSDLWVGGHEPADPGVWWCYSGEANGGYDVLDIEPSLEPWGAVGDALGDAAVGIEVVAPGVVVGDIVDDELPDGWRVATDSEFLLAEGGGQ